MDIVKQDMAKAQALIEERKISLQERNAEVQMKMMEMLMKKG
jgi:hypothetical protein